jgi:hypothetical protein
MTDLTYDAGGLRTVPVTIGGTTWIPELPHEDVIIKRLDEIGQIPDKLESALEMFCFIARSQMFLDGNKRVAQLMCNKIMMENDIGIFSVPYDKIDHFKMLLVKFYGSHDPTNLKSFFRENCLLLNPNYEKTEKLQWHNGKTL